MPRPRLYTVAAAGLAALLVGAIAVAQQPLRRTERVAMRDGIRLATDVYLPRAEGAYPVILVRTPYNKDGMAQLGQAAAQAGYAVVLQDTRGRYQSEGLGVAFEGDGFADHWDGYDTVRWILTQPWCDGKIGTMGGSALGITQLLLAGAGSPNIAVQQIHVGAPDGYRHMVYPGGVWRKALIEDWVRGSQHSPETIRLWQSHPTYDAFWKARTLEGRWANVNSPAIHVGGWYDIFCQGTIDSYLGYQMKGGARARGKQKLLMGPWTHGIFSDKAGELKFPNAKQPPNNVADPFRWFNHYLKGADTGIEREAAVTYYTMGDTSDPAAPGNVWRTADAWPPPATSTPLYLRADRTLAWMPPSAAAAPIAYQYDPAHPCPTTGGPQLTIPAGPMDQKAVESRPDVVVFTSATLRKPLEVTGRVKVELWASSNCSDTDFVAKLCDVYPDGRSYNVCEGILRARFREGFEREKRLTPGKPYRFVIDLWSTSIVFNKGHRLRVQVTSSDAPGWDPNPNTGAGFRADRRIRVATNTLYVDARRPSRIVLPVVNR
jgi:predicted acyl esterase